MQPEPAVASSVVVHAQELSVRLGAPSPVTAPGRIEALLNAAMFAPLAFLTLNSFPRLQWAEMVVVGFAGSLAVEVVQGLMLDARTSQAVDVVANTAGALVGAVVAVVSRPAGSRRP